MSMHRRGRNLYGRAGVEPPPPGAIVIIVSGRKLPDARYTHLYNVYYILLYYIILYK